MNFNRRILSSIIFLMICFGAFAVGTISANDTLQARTEKTVAVKFPPGIERFDLAKVKKIVIEKRMPYFERMRAESSLMALRLQNAIGHERFDLNSARVKNIQPPGIIRARKTFTKLIDTNQPPDKKRINFAGLQPKLTRVS